MAEVRVIGLEIPIAGFVFDGANADAAVGVLANLGKAIAELQLEVGQFLVFGIDQVTSTALVAVAGDVAVFDSPGLLAFLRTDLPTVERLPVEDGNKTVFVRWLFVVGRIDGDASRHESERRHGHALKYSVAHHCFLQLEFQVHSFMGSPLSDERY